MNKNEKAARGAIPSGLHNQNHLIAGGNQTDFVFDSAITEGKLQSDILACINQKPRKVIKLFPCNLCGGYLSPSKMSTHFGICKKCVKAARTKTDREKMRFVDVALNNFHKSLRGAVAL